MLLSFASWVAKDLVKSWNSFSGSGLAMGSDIRPVNCLPNTNTKMTTAKTTTRKMNPNTKGLFDVGPIIGIFIIVFASRIIYLGIKMRNLSNLN